ncbi:hypothetical protein FHX41_0697 [Actinomadura hallensis]|uniref:DUF6924 domain-containing protein n=1 Tax=Actinomadura hallensis TaxID=337895 RepID=A0A543I942_9ACTN|nr:hypothetical protein [Actinomadura hallensis]TQM67098.1 hypothetical protein FHX41_0697 [Actinomadura hallensis]
MTFPVLPAPADGEVLMVCTRYRDGKAFWGSLLNEIGERRDGDVLVPEGGRIRLRVVENTGWDSLLGGNVPALVPAGGRTPPVVVLADGSSAYGGGGPLLVDMAVLPGRGVRVWRSRLGGVLTALLGGELAFDHLVQDMDVSGVYQGGDGRPAFPAPVGTPQRAFPALPSTSGALLVRTSFDDEEAWQALLTELGAANEADEIDVENPPLNAQVVDDRAFEGMQPGQVPALVPPKKQTTLVALADTRTFTGPELPLTVVDLCDTPGQPAVLPFRLVGSMACNLELANMDFRDFVARAGTRPWWEDLA